ncbi:hypothetical protein FGO68_gene7951 [Halteria grandinella]|uniref:Uncharacterized protein n=1 Tax=Halteria grandinella TaxID=5974 RepID=A0A8J8NRY4_HALGN|nr:hypothetical protein FGO68_gene7951 [Halteria grandinella]
MKSSASFHRYSCQAAINGGTSQSLSIGVRTRVVHAYFLSRLVLGSKEMCKSAPSLPSPFILKWRGCVPENKELAQLSYQMNRTSPSRLMLFFQISNFVISGRSLRH